MNLDEIDRFINEIDKAHTAIDLAYTALWTIEDALNAQLKYLELAEKKEQEDNQLPLL